jgi:hypothetical protein
MLVAQGYGMPGEDAEIGRSYEWFKKIMTLWIMTDADTLDGVDLLM